MSNPPGRLAERTRTCVALLKKHVKINYDGAAGNDNFNKYHNVFSGFQMLGFDSNLNNVTRSHCDAGQPGHGRSPRKDESTSL